MRDNGSLCSSVHPNFQLLYFQCFFLTSCLSGHLWIHNHSFWHSMLKHLIWLTLWVRSIYLGCLVVLSPSLLFILPDGLQPRVPTNLVWRYIPVKHIRAWHFHSLSLSVNGASTHLQSIHRQFNHPSIFYSCFFQIFWVTGNYNLPIYQMTYVFFFSELPKIHNWSKSCVNTAVWWAMFPAKAV